MAYRKHSFRKEISLKKPMVGSCVHLMITVWRLQCCVKGNFLGESFQKHRVLLVALFIPKEKTSTNNELDSLLTQEVQVMAVNSKKPRAGVSKTTHRERSCRQQMTLVCTD